MCSRTSFASLGIWIQAIRGKVEELTSLQTVAPTLKNISVGESSEALSSFMIDSAKK